MKKREICRFLFNVYEDIVFDGVVFEIFSGIYNSLIDLSFLRNIDVIDGFLKRFGNNCRVEFLNLFENVI